MVVPVYLELLSTVEGSVIPCTPPEGICPGLGNKSGFISTFLGGLKGADGFAAIVVATDPMEEEDCDNTGLGGLISFTITAPVESFTATRILPSSVISTF